MHTDHFIDPVITFFARSRCVLNRERVYRTLTTLDVFVDRTLCLVSKSETLSGFHYNRDLLKSAMANTYLETVGSRADSIHMAIKSVPMPYVYTEYIRSVGIFGPKTGFAEHDAVLAFDHTDEDFYGKLEGTWIHTWTGDHAVTGKFRFLTCSLVSSDIPQRVPLLSIPVHMGYNIARDVSFCLEFVRPHFKSVRLCLFDRGFYSNELMIALDRMTVPYLIFVPKNDAVKKVLAPMRSGDTMTVEHEFRLNRDRTVIRSSTTYALLRQIYAKRLEMCLDWCFATNQQEIDLDGIIQAYRGRWDIETGFRVQDEATIKSKSKDVRIRFFLFAYEQMLQLIWSVFYKEEVTFKGFLIELSDTCSERLNRAEERASRHTS